MPEGRTEAKDAASAPRLSAELPERYGAFLLRVARRLFGNEEDARDAVQDVYVHLHEVLPRYDKARPFQPWLAATAGRFFLDRLRARKARRRRERRAGEYFKARRTASAAADPVVAAEQRERLLRLRRRLDEMPPEDRALLVLCLERGESLATAAEALGLTRDAARNRLFRLRKLLRREAAAEELPESRERRRL